MAETEASVGRREWALPASPAGEQLGWFLEAVRTNTLTEDVIRGAVTEAFATAVSPRQVLGLTGQLRAALDDLSLSDVVEHSPTGLEAELSVADGSGVCFRIEVEAAAPHRIAGLRVESIPPRGESVASVADLAGVEQRVRADAGFPVAALETVCATTAELFDRAHLVGLQAVAFCNGKQLNIEQGSAALQPTRLAVEPATIFRAYSITKVITATGVLLLHLDGKFDLHDPVNDYLQGYRVVHPDADAPKVTFLHLLSHVSGAPSRFEHWVETVPPTAELFGPELVCDFVPGTERVYSNAGYGTLGQLIEDVSGQQIEDFMAERVFAPLGMTRTGYRRTNAMGPDDAAGYTVRRGEILAAATTVPSVLGAGGLWSTADDLGRFLMAATREGDDVFPEAVAELAFAEYAEQANGSRQGLGWALADVAGATAVWHNGGGHGFSTSMWAVPRSACGVVLLTNVGDRRLDATAAALCETLLRSA